MAGKGCGFRNKPGDPLTDKQKLVLAYMAKYHSMHGSPPTIRQIARDLGIVHLNSVMCHLRALRAKGRVRKSGGATSGHYVAVVPKHCCPACGQQLPQASPN